MRTAIIAALPGELAPLVAQWRQSKTASSKLRSWTREGGRNEWVAVCAGMGADAARRAFAEAEREGTVDMVLSVGWAGALSSSLVAESIVRPSTVIDAQTGETFTLKGGTPGIRLVTTTRVADASEKIRLRDTYGAAAVDMEAATVARLAEMRGIPIACVKAVSDGSDAKLPDLNPFISSSGRMRMLPFVAHVALRPKFWASLVALGRHSAAGSRAMRDTIENLMEGQDAENTSTTGSSV